MSDEKPVPETLESIAASIRELRTSMDSRFDEVPSRSEISSQFDELKAQLRTEIESVRGDVRLVAEAFGSQAMVNERNETAHTGFQKRLDDHDIRCLALERKSGDGSAA
jgi:hypothetical protein